MGDSESIAARQERGPVWPVLLAISLFCIVGGGVAFLLTKPLYGAVALVEVRADELTGNAGPDRIEGERFLIRSRTLIQTAMAGPNWSKGWPTTQSAANEMCGRMSARTVGGRVLEVTYSDTSAADAEGKLKATVMAYHDYVTAQHRAESARRMKVLYDRHQLFASDAARLEQQFLEARLEFDGMDLAVLHQRQSEKVVKLEQAVQDWPALRAVGTFALSNPALSAAMERLKEEKGALVKISRTRLKIEELQRRREAAIAERDRLARQVNDWSISNALSNPVRVLTTGEVSSRPLDRRPRNAALGMLGGFVLFFILRWMLAAWRTRRRVVNARTAFPVVTTYLPKPVIPIEPATGGS